MPTPSCTTICRAWTTTTCDVAGRLSIESTGYAAATAAGLAMVPLAARCATAAAGRLGLSDAVVGTILRELMRAAGAGGMIGGQLLDLEGERLALSLEQLEHIHRAKTGALVTASVRLGGIAAGADATVLAALGRYGAAIGLAFQIADDVLDVTATTDQLGKTAGRDLALHKSTYPALLGVDGAVARAPRLGRRGVRRLDRVGLLTPELERLARYTVSSGPEFRCLRPNQADSGSHPPSLNRSNAYTRQPISRRLTRDQLRELSAEIRARLIDVCSRTGGHIGAGSGRGRAHHGAALRLRHADAISSSGTWATRPIRTSCSPVATPELETLRQENGLSGFLKRSESPYDTFGAGHAATAISAALGMAVARDLRGEHFQVVAVLGDGALTCGLAYEGLNNAGAAADRDIVVILNDNEMSIAPNVGAISKYLTSVQRNPLYNRVRSAIGAAVDHAPGRLSAVGTLVRKWEESVKSFFTPGVLFEELGFRYFGPIDGHDIDALIDTLTAVRDLKGPRLVHVITQKGKGFPAGEHGEKWHALPPGHDPATGKQRTASTVQCDVHRRVRHRTR